MGIGVYVIVTLLVLGNTYRFHQELLEKNNIPRMESFGFRFPHNWARSASIAAFSSLLVNVVIFFTTFLLFHNFALSGIVGVVTGWVCAVIFVGKWEKSIQNYKNSVQGQISAHFNGY